MVTMLRSRLITPEWFEGWFDHHFPPSRPSFTPGQIARVVGCSADTVRREVNCAAIEGFVTERNGRARYYVPRPALRRWLIERNTLNVP